MRNLVLAALVGLVLTGPAEAALFVPEAPDVSDIPQPLPITSPAAGPPIDLIGVPYEPGAVRHATRRLMRHKGIPASAFRDDPAALITSRADLGRFFAYMATYSHRLGRSAWAIVYYCQAARADARYLMPEGIEQDQDERFVADLQAIRFATLSFFVDEVAKPVRVEPSRLPPEDQPSPSGLGGPRP